jgi:ribosomal protein S18 acetylase RimI-like enzyme
VEAARSANDDDLAEIRRLAASADAELRPERGGDILLTRGQPDRTDAAFATLLERDDASLVVGTIDGSVIGYACGEVERLPDGRALGVIREIYVEPGARAVGVGEAMLACLGDLFERSDCIGVDSVALPGNRAAKNFFETNGYSARLIVMHHRLRP